MTNAELIHKFHTLADNRLGRQRSVAIVRAVRHLTAPAADLQQLLEPVLSPVAAGDA
jgi:hypothetical protein